MATIALFIVILAFSLLQYSNNDAVLADQHHRCGLEINALRREFALANITDKKGIGGYTRRYDEILQRYGTNHEPIDYEKYKLEHPHEYPDYPITLAEIKEVKREIKGGIPEIVTTTMSLMIALVSIISFALANDNEVLRWISDFIKSAWN